MPDRERELERELRDLGSHIEYPPTPDLARAVRRSLEGEETARPTGSRRLWSSLPSLRWAVAATAFLLIVAVPALSPTMRATVGGWFETGQAARDAGEPPAAESAGPGALAPSAGVPRPLGEGLGFGNRISLREARTVAGGLLLPQTLGKPDEVYAVNPPTGEGVALVYGARSGLPPLGDTGIGLVLTEVPGDVEPAYFPEGERPETGLQRVQVGGRPGYWAPAGRGVPSLTGERLHGSVLLWEQESVALRLEADIPKQEAIRIAESVR